MNIEDCKQFARVAYVPGHAKSEKDHEHGYVSSHNGKFVFVKFDNSFKRIFGLPKGNGRGEYAPFRWGSVTSQAVDPKDLIPSNEPPMRIYVTATGDSKRRATTIDDPELADERWEKFE